VAWLFYLKKELAMNKEQRTSFKIIKLFILIWFLYSLSSCAFAPVNKPILKKDKAAVKGVFNISSKELLKYSSLTLENMGYKIVNLDEEKGEILTDLTQPGVKTVQIQGNCDCGTWNNIPVAGVSGSAFIIKVSALNPEESKIEIKARFFVKFTGRNLYGMPTSSAEYECESLTGIENQYLTNLGMLVERRTKKENVAQAKQSDIPDEIRGKSQKENDSEFIKGVGESKHLAEQTDRVKSFLFLYCHIYESKDLDKFASLFSPDATENGKAFHELLPKYRKNLEMVESFNYRIELVAYSLSTDTGNIRVKGKYFTQYLIEGKLKEKSGNTSMELIENGDSYLVKRLDYTSQSEPQWKPWVEIGEKK
jgi:hypothetical protein